MPDMNFSTWNHACSKVHEILELQEHIQIILFNISRSSVKSMPANVVYITYDMSLDELAS